jgi:septal ring factor EnvC (AmiA/AmiB activator)
LEQIYDELIQGKPCVVKTTCNAGHRHFCTVVGMKSTVTSREALTEDDLLIIDSSDGDLESMDGSTLEHNKKMYMEYGKYDKRVEEKKKDLSKMKEELANEEKTKEDRKKELEEIKTKNKTKIEELEKWQKKTKKVEESL